MEAESSGAKLKKLRLEKGFSLEEAQKKTKIHLDVLKAIEEDNFINLSPVYAKGFLKIYCKFLGVDYKSYIPDYKELQAQPGAQIKQEEPPQFIKNTPEKRDVSRPKVKLKTIVVILSGIFLAVSLFNLGRKMARVPKKEENKPKVTRAKQPALEKAKPKPDAKLNVKPDTALVEKKVRTETIFQEKNLVEIRLVISAKEDCWMQVKVDRHLVFQNILKKGRFESWKAKDKIELSLGNAGGIDLEINGKLISPLGRRGQVLKNIVITKNGLNIPQ